MSDPRDVLGPVLADAVAALVAEGMAAAVADRPTEEPWPAYMDAPTAARYLGVSEERVRKLQTAGKLAYCQEARGYRVTYPRNALDALMDSWRVEARG
jgi:Helix-turn-helix domain